jgi:hypothetical protein
MRSAATACKHSRHRQSSKPVGLVTPGCGSASRTVSSLHQHGPPTLQVNSVPQRAQASCLAGCFGPLLRCVGAGFVKRSVRLLILSDR